MAGPRAWGRPWETSFRLQRIFMFASLGSARALLEARTMKRRGSLLGLIGLLVILACSPDAEAHTKGLTLSRFGLIDISLQANVDYVNFSDPKRVDFDKIGDRQQKGFNLFNFTPTPDVYTLSRAP